MSDEPEQSGGRLLHPAGWGVPFKMVLMALVILVLVHGEGLLPDRGVPFALAAIGMALVRAEGVAPRPSPGWRSLLAVVFGALLFTYPGTLITFGRNVLGGVLGVGAGASLLIAAKRARGTDA